jgi:hypothetical protein
VNISQIQESLKKVLGDLNRGEFIYELLNAYGKPKASISRLKNGTYNLSKHTNEVLWKKEVLFTYKEHGNLHTVIDEIRKSDLISKHKPRFLIVTNFELFLAIDTKTNETLDVNFAELDKSFDFFLPWAGMEKAQRQNENPADVKAAEKMAKLYDEILKDNPTEKKDELHKLNVFLSRLLFCFFAEDTEIFPKSSFTHSITSHTQQDGSDLDSYLNKLFEALNNQDKSKHPEYLKGFPYVNGGLFTSDIFTPKFSRKSRSLIIECGELDWSAINPDIFGSMFQAVVHTEQRSEMGMHYTSVPNIMKVIEPLFLNELNEKFDKVYESEYKLEQLLLHLEKLRIFDPACGSGNFLIISYREIRFLEMKILKRINELSKNKSLRFSNISLSQFFGIEIDDFAHEIAILSLWLAEHQMNLKFKEVFGSTSPLLPLKRGGNIVCANAARLDWQKICPVESSAETYVLGNPPYLGFSLQDANQKEDLKINWGGTTKLDYISIWFLRASKYIREGKSKFAFVTTNSINQGEQVGLLWTYVLNDGLEIFFAHTSFKWTNNAKKNAGVTCNIVGVAAKSDSKKTLYVDGMQKIVNSINPYLTEGENQIIFKRSKPLSNLPTMMLGDMAKDGGHLVFSKEEANELIKLYPSTRKYLKRFIGAIDFIRGIERWCLWVLEQEYEDAAKNPIILDRFNKVVKARLESDKVATQNYSTRPYRFVEIRRQGEPSIIVPTTSSELRKYIPIGFVGKEDVVTAPNQAIYNPPLYIFAVISSYMHMTWVRAVAGRLESRIRYSSVLCYNTFPFPKISDSQKENLETHVMKVLAEREKNSEKTMSELYDSDEMPEDLKEAHNELDLAIERCYRAKPFTSDEERLEYLFKLYEEMIRNEKS